MSWHKLLAQVEDLLPFTLFALLFGVIKAILGPVEQTLRQKITTILVSVPVGTLAGALCIEFGFGQYASLTMASIASLLAQDILMGIINNKGQIFALFKRAAENVVDKTTK